MRMRGLEPPRACAHTDLNRARLPIPPHPRGEGIVPAAGASPGDVPPLLARERQYASAFSYTQRECVGGDRGRRLATLCSRQKCWRISLGEALAPRSVVALLDHRQVREVALDAAGEVVPLSALGLDEREAAPTPRTPAPRPLLANGPPRGQARPFGADDEDDGASDQDDRDDTHRSILVGGLRRRATAADRREED